MAPLGSNGIPAPSGMVRCQTGRIASFRSARLIRLAASTSPWLITIESFCPCAIPITLNNDIAIEKMNWYFISKQLVFILALEDIHLIQLSLIEASELVSRTAVC